MVRQLEIKPLTRAAFAPFGDVISFADSEPYQINNGMAERYHAIAQVELAGEDASAVVSLVASRKYDMPRRVDHLEYHPYGSQAFIPLDASPFIVVVGTAAKTPDLTGLSAFVTNGEQGINYHQGTWHHVLLTPFAAMRFVCVDRDSPDDNCVNFHIAGNDQPLLELP